MNTKRISVEAYQVLEHQTTGQRMNHVTEEDFNNLIDLALDMKDFAWAEQLSTDKQRHIRWKNKMKELGKRYNND